MTPRDLDDALASAPIEYQTYRLLPGEEWAAPAVEVLRVWPGPACFRRPIGEEYTDGWPTVQGWRPDNPFFLGTWETDDVPFGEDDLWDPAVLLPLLEEIPKPVRAALDPFDGRLGWWVLRLLHDMPQAVAVAQEHPNLAALLGLVREHEPPEGLDEQLRSALAQGAEAALPLARLPQKPESLATLGKFETGVIDDVGVWLCKILTSSVPEVVTALRDLETIDLNTTALLALPELREVCTPELLVDRSPDRGAHARLWSLVLDRAEGKAPNEPARFYSWNEVEEAVTTHRASN